jgi:hypothetical protein
MSEVPPVATTIRPVAGDDDAAGDLVVHGVREARGHRPELRGVALGGQHRLAGRSDPLGDGGDLLGRFAGAVDDLREAFAQGPVVVEARKAEILDVEPLKPEGGRRGRHLPRRDRLQKRPNRCLVHWM